MHMARRRYTRRQFMTIMGLGLAGTAVPQYGAHGNAPARAKSTPNILVILSDEHNAGVLGCAGNEIIRTSNLDALAARGVVFENGYCNSPLCVPSRLSFTSGKYASRVGAWNNDCWLPSADYPSLPGMLKKAGYEAFLCGKMHYDVTRRYGFTEIGGAMNQSIMMGRGSRRAPDDLQPMPGISERFEAFHAGDTSSVMEHDRRVTAGTVGFLKNRKRERLWKKHLPIHLTALVLCSTILVITSIEKFRFGGWLTLVITSLVIALCYAIRSHYQKVKEAKAQLDEILMAIPTSGKANKEKVDPKDMTAIMLVRNFDGFGIHTLLSINRNFPHMYKNFVFASVAVADSGVFKGSEAVSHLEEAIRAMLKRYVQLARNLGLRADFRLAVGTDVVQIGTQLCTDTAKEFPRSTVFAGKILFQHEKFYHRILHNETAFAIQRNLHWSGIPAMILPIRVQI